MSQAKTEKDKKENETKYATKYTKYISDNYFWISYKTLFYVIAKAMKLPEAAKWIKDTYGKTKKDVVPSIGTSNKEQEPGNCEGGNKQNGGQEDEIGIAEFVEHMD